MKKSYIWIGVVVVVIALLLGWGKIAGTTKPLTFWKDTKVQCLPNGHTNLAQHIHQLLMITVDGVKEEVPGNIGSNSTCLAETHTHSEPGEIHVETAEAGRVLTLGDFFAVWGKSIDRPGYTVALTVNGSEKLELGALVLADHQTITLAYTKAATE